MAENTENRSGGDTGGEPEAFGQCTKCGKVYPIRDQDGTLRPVGTGGSCECGNDEFERLT